MPKGLPDRPETLLRDARVLELRIAGLTFQEIADAVDFASAGAAHNAYRRAMQRTIQEPADELRKQMGMRLDRMQSQVWARAQTGDEDAIAICLKIEDRRAKLFGLDVPVRREVEVFHVTPEVLDADAERIRLQLEAAGINVAALPTAEDFYDRLVEAEILEAEEVDDEDEPAR